RLNDPFANQYGEPDENNTVVYTRINAEEGAEVKGINIEMNFIPGDYLTLKSGFTLQNSKYDEEQEFNEKEFTRTPGDYGYISFTLKPSELWALSLTGNYTGKMLIPYFGPRLSNPDEGELRNSQRFFDMGMKLRYNIKLNGTTIQISGGIKNIFNSYQKDFDEGLNRDPGYIYGPLSPRAVYFGIKIGNFIRFPRNPL
ncbi:MAG: TonB-dependent receptor, partial [Bacteroidales bacterium]|nr:TonB-dependent receptor [Bacteroidales bacterium]